MAALLPVLAAAGPAAGAAGAAGAASALSFSSILSLGLTGASAFGQIMAGQQQAAASRFQAKQSELQARAEELKGREQALEISKRLERDTATAAATFAARGGLSGEGSAFAAIQAGRERATQDINNAMFNTANTAGALRAQAGQYRADAKAATQAGFYNAVSTIGSSKRFQSLLE